MTALVVFALNIVSPEMGANFLYSNANPGVCEIPTQAEATPDEYTVDIAPWKITSVQGVVITTDPTPAKGGFVIFKYTQLPMLNEDFGKKKIETSLIEAGARVDANPVEIDVFFPKFGVNHPPEAPPNIPSMFSPEDNPNWFYYWSQAQPPLSTLYFYDASFQSPEGWNSEWGFLRPGGSNTNLILGRDYIKLYDADREHIHKCGTGLVHENTHHNDWNAVWPTDGCWIPEQDVDQDWLRDDWEEPFPDELFKVGRYDWDFWIDEWSQEHAIAAENAVPPDAYDSQDWAYPGRQWSGKKLFAIRGGRYDETIITASDTVTKDFWMINMSIEQIMWLESRDPKIKTRLKTESNLRKIAVESEKRRLQYLSVDSLIAIIKRALEYGRQDTTMTSIVLRNVSWGTVEAAALLLGKKGDKRALSVLEELQAEPIWVIGDRGSSQSRAKLAAARSIVELELSPSYHDMNKKEKISTLLQIMAKETSAEIYLEQHPIYCILADFAWEPNLLSVWIDALSDSSRWGREVATKILLMNPQIESYDALVSRATMVGELESIRSKIIFALGRLKSKRLEVVSVLEKLAEDQKESQKIREIARFVLEQN